MTNSFDIKLCQSVAKNQWITKQAHCFGCVSASFFLLTYLFGSKTNPFYILNSSSYHGHLCVNILSRAWLKLISQGMCYMKEQGLITSSLQYNVQLTMHDQWQHKKYHFFPPLIKFVTLTWYHINCISCFFLHVSYNCEWATKHINFRHTQKKLEKKYSKQMSM